ncbi:hypothetical protein THOG11_120119 [Vibrio harveyi]|nr:hypothetical protein TH15OA1_410121 [Vibrio harveyi]CAH1548347.1 hypothetical protein THOD03_110119 [Vibrio harveyi]CAH1552727.1 hypothetical protein THOG11_120119 [Vibrio harveyi]
MVTDINIKDKMPEYWIMADRHSKTLLEEKSCGSIANHNTDITAIIAQMILRIVFMIGYSVNRQLYFSPSHVKQRQ